MPRRPNFGLAYESMACGREGRLQAMTRQHLNPLFWAEIRRHWEYDPDSPSYLLACRRAFLEGYGLDPDVPNPLLTAYETDKAGYEVSYEARYRPHLMRVPLDFLSQLPEGA